MSGMRITCERYPNLLITKPSVRFEDGVAEVDERTAALLAPIAESFGIGFDTPPGRHAHDDGAPRRGRRRRDADE